MQRAFLAIFALCLAASAPEAGRARNAAHWGGADLPVSCDTVRSYRPQIEGMTRAARTALARQFGITRKQRRQAEACLRERG